MSKKLITIMAVLLAFHSFNSDPSVAMNDQDDVGHVLVAKEKAIQQVIEKRDQQSYGKPFGKVEKIGAAANANFLHQYDADSYNTFDSPEKAHIKIKKHPSFDKFLGEAFNLIDKENIPIGFRLLHKHNGVLRTQGMVERFEPLFTPLQTPAYITRPYNISYESSCFITEDAKKIYPASWKIGSGNSYRVFEFSTDEVVRSTTEKLSSNPNFMHTISQMILEHNLENLIGPAVLSRSTSSHFKTTTLLERQFSNYGSVVIVPSNLDKIISAIQTSWSSQREDNCDPITKCDPDYDEDGKKIGHTEYISGHYKDW